MVGEVGGEEVRVDGVDDVGGDEEGVGVGLGEEGGGGFEAVGEGVGDALEDGGEEVTFCALAELGADFFVVE